MISISVSLSDEQQELIGVLRHIPEAAGKAVARAINRAAEGARTDVIKSVCAEYSIRAADVRKTIHIVRANPKKLEASIISTGRPIPLIKFNVKPKKPGGRKRTVIAGVKIGSATEMPHSFIQKMKNGHVGVFSREINAGRIPISQHYSPSVPQMIGNSRVIEFINQRAHERLDKELRHQITYLLGGGK